MAQTANIFVSALGGTALVLGVAYGWTARDYRNQEIDMLTEQLAQIQQRNADLGAKLDEIAPLKADIAALQAALSKAEEASKAAPVAVTAVVDAPAPATPVTQGSTFGDAQKGQAIFRKCQSCHSVGQGAEDRVGPHLNGIFGRRAGAHDGFKYSQDMSMMGADGLTWTLDTLDAYLENPKALVSRTRMNFSGLKKPEDRADVLAFLRQFSDSPQNIPEAEATEIAPEVELSADILAIVGDREYGEYLASECETCHQRSGANDGIPSIIQWPEGDFVIAMHAYKQKIRPHPVMQMMAGRLSDEEIAALAAYFKDVD